MVKDTASPADIYAEVVKDHGGNVEGVSPELQVKWFMEKIAHGTSVEPLYLNAAPELFWKHKIETGEIKYMK